MPKTSKSAKHNRAPLIGDHDYAMTLKEIARCLGTSHKNVAMIQKKAIRKLREHPEAFENFRQLVAARAALRAEREQEDRCA
jgi:DNA-directed RNA polymerase sigma subunit (sigma70/sigma32)